MTIKALEEQFRRSRINHLNYQVSGHVTEYGFDTLYVRFGNIVIDNQMGKQQNIEAVTLANFAVSPELQGLGIFTSYVNQLLDNYNVEIENVLTKRFANHLQSTGWIKHKTNGMLPSYYKHGKERNTCGHECLRPCSNKNNCKASVGRGFVNSEKRQSRSTYDYFPIVYRPFGAASYW